MNVSTEELKAIDERKQMKNELKAKWQRMSTNPHAGGQGGHQVRCCPVTLRTHCPVWDPHGIVVKEELEKVQNHAARFV